MAWSCSITLRQVCMEVKTWTESLLLIRSLSQTLDGMDAGMRRMKKYSACQKWAFICRLNHPHNDYSFIIHVRRHFCQDPFAIWFRKVQLLGLLGSSRLHNGTPHCDSYTPLRTLYSTVRGWCPLPDSEVTASNSVLPSETKQRSLCYAGHYRYRCCFTHIL